MHFYKRIWPEMLSADRLDADSVWQRSGVDRLIVLPNGKLIRIDEKKRFPKPGRTGFDDFLCEEWSVAPDPAKRHPGKIGWTLDSSKQCDFVVYAIPEFGKAYVLSFEVLRWAARAFLSEWKKLPNAYPKNAQNNGYVTRNCAVPWGVLRRDMWIVSERKFGARLELPTPVQNGNQVEFHWASPPPPRPAMTIREVSERLNQEALRFCETHLPAGKKVGHEWLVGDCYGAAGNSTAVALDGPKQGLWNDRANADSHGDLLKLVEYVVPGVKGPVAASNWARKFLGLPAWAPNGKSKPQGPPEWDPMKASWWCQLTKSFLLPFAAYKYLDADGNLIGWCCRYKFPHPTKKNPDGSPFIDKDILPWRPAPEGYKTKLGKPVEAGKWINIGWAKERKERPPIYNLHLVSKAEKLLICEGEKKADLVPKLFPGWTGISWQGGGKNSRRVDWSPLSSFKGPIVLWPDADSDGQDAMVYLKSRLTGSLMVRLPKGLPDGWDIADPVPEGVSLQGLLDAALAPPPPPNPDGGPYVPLGTDERGYNFLSRSEGYVLHFQPSALSELNLCRLADDEHWSNSGFSSKSGVDYKAVAKSLIRESQDVGSFDPRKLRGRGVFDDAGRIVFNAGNCLYVSDSPGEPLRQVKTIDFKSEFLYPHRPAIRGFNPDYGKDFNPSELLTLLELCSWQNLRDACFMAGAMFLSFMPSILPWRPHLFMQAASGSGKTWILVHAEIPLLGDFAFRFLAPSSTEAGVRQTMGIDRLAVILEEFDAEDDRHRETLRNIYTLARQASSATGCIGAKGTTDGVARHYDIASNFFFHGTASGIIMKADRSRVAVLELVNRDQGFDDTFAKIKACARASTESPGWSARFAGRALSLVRETLDACRVFSDAVSIRVRDSRAADQFGSLLAGAWMCEHDTPPSPEMALQVVDGVDWDGIKPESTETDHSICLNHLLAYVVDYDSPSGRRSTPIGELLRRACDMQSDAAPEARQALLRWGIRVDPLGTCFQVANRHAMLAKVFSSSPYAEKWSTQLRRVPGAKVHDKAFKFGSVGSRAIELLPPVTGF